jgi:hypothetical protein
MWADITFASSPDISNVDDGQSKMWRKSLPRLAMRSPTPARAKLSTPQLAYKDAQYKELVTIAGDGNAV